MTKPTVRGKSVDAITAAAVLLLGLLLCFVASGLFRQLKEASARQQEPGIEELLAAGAAIAGAGIVAWWLMSLACAAATALLDRTGRIRAAAVTRQLSPAFMQRLVLGALSIQLLSGPAAHAAATGPGPEWGPTPGGSSSAPVIAGAGGAATEETSAEETSAGGAAQLLLEPSTGTAPLKLHVQAPQASGETPVTARERAPLPEQAASVEATPPSTFQPGWQPAAPVVDPGMLAAPAARTSPEASWPHVEGITVQAGDTLWEIAARHLGHGASDLDIALQWPRWYEANRALIGHDPDVLLPGQILQPPGQK